MAKIERVYIIPLRKEWLKTPKYRRAKKAAIAVREFLIKHMKSENVKIGRQLNMNLWAKGIKSPPGNVKVSVVKEEDGKVKAELFGHKFEEVEKSEKTKKAEKPVDKLKEKLLGKEKPEEKKEVKKEEKKVETPTEKLAEELKKPENTKPVPLEKKPVVKEVPKPEAKPAAKKE